MKRWRRWRRRRARTKTTPLQFSTELRVEAGEQDSTSVAHQMRLRPDEHGELLVERTRNVLDGSLNPLLVVVAVEPHTAVGEAPHAVVAASGESAEFESLADVQIRSQRT